MLLIIQGAQIETGDLKALAKTAGASGIEQISASAFRLRNAQPAPDIATLCEASKLDFAFIPEDRRLADFRLLVMDMDSTLITIETIDELAALVGLKPQVAAITEQAMRGEIEYNESLRRRVAVLKGLDESALKRVYDERLKLSPGAEVLLAAAKQHGIKTLLVSGGFRYFTGLKIDNMAVFIMSVFTTAGNRAIMIGIALGIVSTALKILLGLDRSYLGKD